MNSQPSFTPENGKIHFSKFLCNVARSHAIAQMLQKPVTIALFRYGPIFIYGKLVIELLKFIWGDSNTEFKDVDFGGKKLTLKQKKYELNTTFSESLLNSELIKSANVYSLSFLGDCEGFISMTLSQFFISQGMQLNIILNSFYLLNHKT